MESASPSPIVATANEGRPPRPWLAGLLTLLGVGVGHAYAGRWLRGIARLLLAVVAQLAVVALLLRTEIDGWPLVALLIVVPIGTFALAIADAVRTARRAPPRRTPWWL